MELEVDARWADTRIHGTTKRQVAAMFADERPHLRALPVEPFRYYAFGDRPVHLDGFDIACRPSLSQRSISSRYGSHDLAVLAAESVITSAEVAGFELAGSVITLRDRRRER